MTIRNRIAFQFSLIVAFILIVFSLNTYIRSRQYREREFYERLEQRARTTVRFLTEVEELDRNLLRVIDRNTLITLYDQKVLVFDARNRLLYASIDSDSLAVPLTLLAAIRQQGVVRTLIGERQVFGLHALDGKTSLTVVASAEDRAGHAELDDLRQTLSWGLLVGISLTIALGIVFAGQALQPISRINREVQTINAQNLRQRLDEGNRRDEVAKLAFNFNQVLSRLQQAFEQQRTFISHASHELRTPLTALKTELQLSLRRVLTVDQYQQILTNLLTDTDRIIDLTNSLLLLARSLDGPTQPFTASVQIDDVVFAARDELLSAWPAYRVDVTFTHQSELDEHPQLPGDEALLRRMVLNLLDNACKYSFDHQASVAIDTDTHYCRIHVSDRGIGIPAHELAHIFDPFYRADNAKPHHGFGLGLSICRRIAERHQGWLEVTSQPGSGSTFSVVLPLEKPAIS